MGVVVERLNSDAEVPLRVGGLVDPWLVAGASLYWSSVGMRYLGGGGGFSLSARAVALEGVARYVLLAVYLVICYLVMRRLTPRRARAGFALVVVGISALILVLSVAPLSLPPATRPFLVSLDFLSIALFMLLWGMAFASMDKARAAQNVAVTALVTALLVLVCSALPPAVPMASVAYLLSAASGMVMLEGRAYMVNLVRERVPGDKGRALAVVAQRLFFGMLLGFCALARNNGSGQADVALAVVGIALVAGALLTLMHPLGRLYTLQPTLVLFAVLVVSIPWIDGGLTGLLASSALVVWIAWSGLSGVQLSELKETLGASELGLCAVDKVLLAASFAVGAVLYGVVDGLAPVAAHARELSAALLACVLAAGLMTAYVMADLVSLRKDDEVKDELVRAEHQRAEHLYDGLAEEFSLSAREREVVEMLAEGYTSTYITDVLGVSYGTVKAHIAHIYQKMGVHRKDDLLDLIDARRSCGA